MGKYIMLLTSTLFLLVSCSSQTSLINKTVVRDFDIEKYLGRWYEIARYDHKFEKDLVGVTANYSFRDDGKIKVVNSGYKKSLDGKKSEATGKAKIPNPDIPAQLKVSFFWFFYSDYYIMELDNDYQWAVVGSSSDNYLWILSRTPQMEEDLYDEILKRVTDRGYDVSKLILVDQKR